MIVEINALDLKVNKTEIGQVNDMYNGTCIVKVLIHTDVMVYHWWIPEPMPYGETWEDKDVEEFIENQLKEMG